MIDYYAYYLTVAQGFVQAGSLGEKDLTLTAQALTEIIQNSLAAGLVIGGLDTLIQDEHIAAVVAREYFKIYLNQVSQIIPINVTNA